MLNQDGSAAGNLDELKRQVSMVIAAKAGSNLEKQERLMPGLIKTIHGVLENGISVNELNQLVSGN
jgi:hypothetical protein